MSQSQSNTPKPDTSNLQKIVVRKLDKIETTAVNPTGS